MALDRTFALMRPDPPERLTPAAPPSAGWNVVLARDVAFVIPPGSGPDVLETLRRRPPNPYAALQDDHGVLAVSPVRADGQSLVLGGGSYSTVALELEDERPVVRKRVVIEGDPDPDRERHLRRVCSWFARLPPDVTEVFPRVVRVREDEGWLELVMEFVPGYSLAELVFQGRLTGDGLGARLEDVYRTVQARMWSRPPIDLHPPCEAGGYLPRIRRRFETIAASGYPASGPVRAVLKSRDVTVNGIRCTPVAELLAELDDAEPWRPAVAPEGAALCHGDLTLEAVVAEDSPAGFRLLDPNPRNQHPVYDAFKTAMSLLLRYEFLYFDRFDIAYDEADGAVRVELTLEEAALQEIYERAAERFIAFAAEELADPLGFPAESVPSLLRMGAAVNMLALPVFHLHRGDERRALAFAAMGLWHAQAARIA